MKESVKSAVEMEDIAERFVEDLKPDAAKAIVIGLCGDLGAGKTTFAQAVGKGLGVLKDMQSPTFVIMKRYPLENQQFDNLIHIDAYRLEKSSELVNLGWQEMIQNPKNLVLIEWPEKVADIMPEHTKINFKHVSENEREIEINL